MKTENKDFIFVEPSKNNLSSYIKRVLLEFYAHLLKIKLNHYIPRMEDKKHYVSICAIFKDEGHYLKEWIDFHIKVGINHFYLYNNFSSDNYLEVLTPYIQDGIVDLVDWAVPQGQLSAYKDCIEKKTSETNWIAFIDIDEFIVPLKQVNFTALLKKFENRPVVKLYWKIYGSSGIGERNVDEEVVNSFTKAWPKLMNFGKCIFNTSYTFDESLKQNNAFHHHMWAKYQNILLPPVNVFDEISLGGRDVLKKELPVQLNHYIIKSKSEFKNKKARGDVFYKLSSVNEEYFVKYNSLADTDDYSAIIFLNRNVE